MCLYKEIKQSDGICKYEGWKWVAVVEDRLKERDYD